MEFEQEKNMFLLGKPYKLCVPLVSFLEDAQGRKGDQSCNLFYLLSALIFDSHKCMLQAMFLSEIIHVKSLTLKFDVLLHLRVDHLGPRSNQIRVMTNWIFANTKTHCAANAITSLLLLQKQYAIRQSRMFVKMYLNFMHAALLNSHGKIVKQTK